MALVHNLDSKNIKLEWNLENKRVRVVCHSPKMASAYIANLIHQKRIGTISVIFYKENSETNVTWLICGEQIIKFIQEGMKTDYKVKSKLTDYLEGETQS